MAAKRGVTPAVDWSAVPADAPTGSFLRLVPRWLTDLERRQYTPASRKTWASALGLFVVWCQERGLDQPSQVTRAVLEAYQRHLSVVRRGQGRARCERSTRTRPSQRWADGGHRLSPGVQRSQMRAIQRWFVWLVRQGYLGANPAADLDHPRLPHHLPDVLTPGEVAAVLAQCDLTNPEGLRDRTFLEVVCATGLRRSEAARLDERDLDEGQGVILVREGKGRKDRYVPASPRAFAWVARYRREVRAVWCRRPSESRLFLRPDGEPVSDALMGARVHRLLALAGITKRGACHLFRHTFAGGLLEQGCDIRLIGAMLGHHHLSSTALYTQVAVGPLVRAHANFHRLPEAAAPSAAKEKMPAGDPPASASPSASLPST